MLASAPLDHLPTYSADGHRLLVHGRANDDRAEALVADLLARGAAGCKYIAADLSDLDQVERLAAEVLRNNEIQHIDVLCNNAGVFDPADRVSAQGYDVTWQVNVIAPFLLTRRLLPLLLQAEAPRVITTSSISQSSRLDFDNVSVVKVEVNHT